MDELQQPLKDLDSENINPYTDFGVSEVEEPSNVGWNPFLWPGDPTAGTCMEFSQLAFLINRWWKVMVLAGVFVILLVIIAIEFGGGGGGGPTPSPPPTPIPHFRHSCSSSPCELFVVNWMYQWYQGYQTNKDVPDLAPTITTMQKMNKDVTVSAGMECGCSPLGGEGFCSPWLPKTDAWMSTRLNWLRNRVKARSAAANAAAAIGVDTFWQVYDQLVAKQTCACTPKTPPKHFVTDITSTTAPVPLMFWWWDYEQGTLGTQQSSPVTWLTAITTEDFESTVTKRVDALKQLVQYLQSNDLGLTIGGMMSEDTKLLVQASKNPENYEMYFNTIASWLQQGRDATGNSDTFEWYLLDSDSESTEAPVGKCSDTAQEGAERMRYRFSDGAVARPYLVYVQYQMWAYRNQKAMYTGYQLDLECGGSRFYEWVAGSLSTISNDMQDFCDCVGAPEAVRKTAGLQILCNDQETRGGYCEREAAGVNVTAGELSNRIANIDTCDKFWL